MTSAIRRVVYYRIHDRTYPRNTRIRQFLASAGFDVTTITPSRARGRILRLGHDVYRLWQAARRADVVVLSELRLTHAPLVTLVGRATGCVVVIDGFVGLHETTVGDWGAVSPRSLRALILRLQDLAAVAGSDIYLIDTEVRAEAIRRRYSRVGTVLALPVGAPGWAVPQPSPGDDERLRLLYYGNYIPLHGLDLVVDALVALRGRRPFTATFVGDGVLRAGIEARVQAAGLDGDCRFVDLVPEADLASLIGASDVILGVFGSSPKAQTVVANKVWQGLACGRTVVTRDTDAVRELDPIVGELLVRVAGDDPAALADALAAVPSAQNGEAAVSVDLERWVSQAFEQFGDELSRHIHVRSSR